MDAETRARAEAWLTDPGTDEAARALLAIILDRPSEPSLLSAEEAADRAAMAHAENAVRLDTLLAEYVMERG